MTVFGIRFYDILLWKKQKDLSSPINTVFDFCFDGIEKHSTVAVGMIGSKREQKGFMLGYNTMLDVLDPSNIIVFGDPFPEMKGNIIAVDYLSSRKVVRSNGR